MENDYFFVWDWMIQSLHLSGSPLIIYALIYDAPRREQKDYATLEDIQEWLGLPPIVIKSAVRVLAGKRLICVSGERFTIPESIRKAHSTENCTKTNSQKHSWFL